MELKMLLDSFDWYLTPREKTVIMDRIGILGIEFTDEELQMNVADVFKNHNVSFITKESICEKYNISVARLKLLERKYMSKSGMERKSRSKVLRDYLEE